MLPACLAALRSVSGIQREGVLLSGTGGTVSIDLGLEQWVHFQAGATPLSSFLIFVEKNAEVRLGAVPELALNQAQCIMKAREEQGHVHGDRHSVLRVC